MRSIDLAALRTAALLALAMSWGVPASAQIATSDARVPDLRFDHCLFKNTNPSSRDYGLVSSASWMGGDNGRFVQLDSYRTIWFFSDSIIRLNQSDGSLAADRSGAVPVVNTIAIGANQQSAANGPQFNPYYYAKHNGSAPTDFFSGAPNVKDGQRYWLNKAFRIPGVPDVFVFGNITGSKFGEFYGTDLIRITNPTADPYSWDIRYITFCGGNQPTFGDEVVQIGPYTDSAGRIVYDLIVYGTFNGGVGNPKTVAVKISSTDVLNATTNGTYIGSATQYCSKSTDPNYLSGTWTTLPSASTPGNPLIPLVNNAPDSTVYDVGVPSTSGYSITQNPQGFWQCVFPDNRNFPGTDGHQPVYASIMRDQARGASGWGPLGPWEQKQNLIEVTTSPNSNYGFEEYRDPRFADPSTATGFFDTICYQTYQIPEFTTDPAHKVRFTYNTDKELGASGNWNTVNPTWNLIYHPKTVEVNNPLRPYGTNQTTSRANSPKNPTTPTATSGSSTPPTARVLGPSVVPRPAGVGVPLTPSPLLRAARTPAGGKVGDPPRPGGIHNPLGLPGVLSREPLRGRLQRPAVIP